MTNDSEEKLLARLYYSIEGKKPKKDSWIHIANGVASLEKLYGSVQEVAKKLNLSKETVREILKILDLSDEAKTLLNEQKIAYDAAWRLASIDKKKQNDVAKAIIGLNAHDARDIVRYARIHPNEEIEDYAKRLITSKGTTRKIKLLILPLDEDIYEEIKAIASKSKLNISDFIERLIYKQLKNRGK